MYLSTTVIQKHRKYRAKKLVGCIILSSFTLENGIAFNVNNLVNGKWLNLYSFKLNFKNGKFNFYRTRHCGTRLLRIINPERLINECRYFEKSEGKTKRPSHGLCPIQEKRLYQVIKQFCKSKKVNIKHLSKNPINLIKQLCYPGLQILNEEVKNIELSNAGRYAKSDITKSIFKTNGTKTRKLILSLIKKYPKKFNNLVILGRTLNKLVGLDKTQSILERLDISNYNFNVWRRDGIPSIKQIEKEYIKLLSRFTTHQIEKFFDEKPRDSWTVSDTYRMMEQIEELPNFENINDLHEKLAELTVTQQERINRAKQAERLTEQLKDIKIIPEIQKLLDNWDNTQFTLRFPKNGVELCEWSKYMSNCVGSYERGIRKGSDVILGIYEGNNLKYNIGFTISRQSRQITNTQSFETLTVYKTETVTTIKFSQWSGKHNSQLIKEDRDILKPLFEKSLGIKIEDYWRNERVERINDGNQPF